MDETDLNGNYYPAIYTRNITNSPTHLDQIAVIVNRFRMNGVGPVSSSAYLKKCIFTAEHHQERLEKVLLSLKNSQENDNPVVFVYDIADVTTLSVSNLGELAELIPETNWQLLGLLKEDLVSKSNCYEIYDTDNLHDPVLASQFETFKQIYNSISKGFDREKSIISEELFELVGIVEEDKKRDIRQIIVEHQKVFHQRWKTVEKCSRWVQKMTEKTNKKYANVVLCHGNIATAGAELLISGLSSTFPLDNVFSKDFRVFTPPVFERIRNRFGKNCVLIHVVSSRTMYDIYGKVPHRQTPVWWISANESIEQLYRAQRDVLSK